MGEHLFDTRTVPELEPDPGPDGLGPLLSDADIELLTISEQNRVDVEDATGEGRDLLPPGVEAWLPGVFLAAVASSVDRTRLSGHDLVDLLTVESRLVSHFQSRMYSTMVEVSHRTDAGFGVSVESHEEACDEIRAALALTRRTAETEFITASDLIERLPQVGAALADGEIDLRRAKAISYQTGHLDPDTARSAADQILPTAPDMTSGQITARLRRICISADPQAARKHYETGLEERRVYTETNPDGTANQYGLNLPPDRVYEANQRINQIARGLKTGDETRTLDQIRADVYLDLLCGTSGDTKSGHVDITVELTTLAGLDDHPGDLNGMGPVIADIARQATARQQDAQWAYTITDQGRPLATGTTSRRPTRALQRHNQALYPTCIFPGCRMPARDCDIDHRQPRSQNGPTSLPNLAPLCRHDHQLKDQANWDLQRNPDGTHTWTSPLGHHYTTGPDPP